MSLATLFALWIAQAPFTGALACAFFRAAKRRDDGRGYFTEASSLGSHRDAAEMAGPGNFIAPVHSAGVTHA